MPIISCLNSRVLRSCLVGLAAWCAAGFGPSLHASPLVPLAPAGTPSSIDGFNPNVNGPVNVMVLVPGPSDLNSSQLNQILIGGNFTQIQPRGAPKALDCNNVARLRPDGTADPEFYPDLNGQVYAIALQPGGPGGFPYVIVAGAFSTVNGSKCTNVARLNPNGTLDTTFHQPVLTGNFNISDVYALAVQPDGSILLGGQFTTINGTQRAHIARLTPSGDLDTTFDPEASAAVLAIALQPNGAMVVGGAFATLAPGAATKTVAPVARGHIARVNADGSLDSSFDPEADKSVSVITLQADGRVLIGGNFNQLQPNGTSTATITPDFARLNADGTLDTTFIEPDPNGAVSAIAVQPDGRIMVGGNFFSLQPTSTTNIQNGEQVIRLNPDGTLDEPFIFNVGINGTANAIVVQPDGQVVVAGNFNQINAPGAPTLCGNMARFDANGLQDVTFDPSATNNVLAIAGQLSTNDLIVGGNFTNVGGVTAQFLARVNAEGVLDPTFTPLVNGPIKLAVVEPDNTIIIAGQFSTVGVNATPRNGLARLKADGTLDMTFDPHPNVNNSIDAIYVQANGQIVLGGSFTDLQPNNSANETQRDYIARVNPDGSLDTKFDPEASAEVTSIAQQSDGKLIVGGNFTQFTPSGGSNVNALLVTASYVARLNTDGTVDQSFNPMPNAAVSAVAVQSDGKIVLGGQFNFLAPNFGVETTELFLARVLPNGNIDTTFDSPSFGNAVNRIILGTGGQIYVGGLFGVSANVGSTYYGASVGNFIVRLKADGTLDTAFAASLNGPIEGLFLQTDGTVYVAGDFSASGTVAINSMVHFTATGSLDPNFRLSSGSAGFDPNSALSAAAVNALALEAAGATIIGGNFPQGIAGETSTNLMRVYMNGSADLGFNPNPNGQVNAIATLSGSTPVATQVSGLIWLNSDGTPKTSFQLPAGFQISGNVGTILADTAHNWLYIAGGYVNTSNGTIGSNLNRFNLTTGALDTTFNPNPQGTVQAIGVQLNGQIVIGGSFTTVRPLGATTATVRNYIARLNPDGSIDPSFDPNLNGVVSAVNILANGQIVIGGNFTTEMPNGTTTQYTVYYIALLNADGTVDTKFKPTPDGQVYSITVQTDGKIVCGGVFTTMEPNGASSTTFRAYIARLNPDGSLDTGFDPEANGGVACIVEQSDGKLLIGGEFTTLSPGLATQTPSSPVTTIQRDYLARLNEDGTVDTAFNPNPDNAVNSIALAADGVSIFVGGDFTAFQPASDAIATPRFFLALLSPTGTVIPSFDPVVNSDVVRVLSQPGPGYGSVIAIGDITGSQPSGTLVVGGAFASNGTQTDPATGKPVATPCIGDVAANYLAELREDGTANANFLPDPDGAVYALAVQPDNKIIVGGAFTHVQSDNGLGDSVPTKRNFVARINADGTLDMATSTTPGFDPEADGAVDAIALQGNGDIVIGGAFTNLQPNGASSATHRAYIARLNPLDGSVDSTFNASLAGAVSALSIQPDGKILVAGSTSTAGQGYLVRLNSDGTADPSFTATVAGTVNAILLQAAGGFTSAGGVLAPTFDPSQVGGLSSAGSRILIGGLFTSVDGTAFSNLARLNSDGSVDTTFNPGPDGAVNAMQLQPDGRLAVAGAFNKVGGQPRFRVARLGQISPIITETLAVSTDLESILWTIDGGPEYSQVYFQLSINDNSWANLGLATRVGSTSDWLLTGLVLPPDQIFYVRAVAIEPTTQGGSSGLVVFTSAFPSITPTTVYPEIGTATSVSAVLGQPFVYFLGMSNSPTGLSVTGLPAGLSFDSGTGVISGTPTAAGTYQIPVTLTNAYTSTLTTLTLTVGAASTAAPVAPTSRLIAVAANDFVDANDPLIAGLWIAGNSPKTVLLRAAGPSLKPYGVTNPLANPVLSLYNTSNQNLLTAKSWGGSSALAEIFAQVGAVPFDPASADAAVVTTLAPGGYTVLVADGGGAASTGGVAVAEVFDADSNPLSLGQRINALSGRGEVTASNTLIGGFWIDGGTSKTVLIRGAGPALTGQGVPNALQAPVLNVYDVNGKLIATNQGWGTQASVSGSPYPAADEGTVANAIAASGAYAFVPSSNDTAVVLTLPPGGYTAQISGAGGTSGNAMFEIFEVP